MRKIRSIARLKFAEQRSVRDVARTLGVSRDSVQTTLDRLALAGLAAWPLPDDLDDAALEAKLFPSTGKAGQGRKLTDADCAEIEAQMAESRCDLRHAHSEFCMRTGSTISYSYFVEVMRKFRKRRKVSMRQIHHPGDAVYVDFSGTLAEVKPSGFKTPIPVEIFVGTLGCSRYFYVEAVPSQKKPNFLMAHVRMFEFIGGVPKAIVCDNLKAAVVKASRHAPVLNDSYVDLAEHYGCAILPARARKPQDKSAVENTVKIVRRWILMRLRGRTFETLEELNAEIRRLVDEANAREFQKMPGSRLSRFQELDKPALKPLPSQPYEYREFRTAHVSPQYHVEVGGSRYSVPYRFANMTVDLIVTERSVTAFYKGERIAVHPIPLKGEYVTDAAHMPDGHRYIEMWTQTDALDRAAIVGPAARAFLEAAMAQHAMPVQQRAVDSRFQKLCRTYGNADVEGACSRVMEIGAVGIHRLEKLLKSKAWRIVNEPRDEASFNHKNIRGSENYK